MDGREERIQLNSEVSNGVIKRTMTPPTEIEKRRTGFESKRMCFTLNMEFSNG